jgi:hypothetical protein
VSCKSDRWRRSSRAARSLSGAGWQRAHIIMQSGHTATIG